MEPAKSVDPHQRLLRLEKHVSGKKIELSDEQIRLLDRFSPEFRERHIETRYTGDLVAVDTFFAGASEMRRKSLFADRYRLLFPIRLETALYIEDAGDDRARHEQRCPTDLRSARRHDHNGSLRI